MTKSCNVNRLVLIALCASTMSLQPRVCRGQTDASPQSDAGSRWRLSAGAMYRHAGGITLKPGSQSDGSMIPLYARPGRSGAPSAVGDAAAFADRTYDDGFVNTDPGTALDGDTWFWGYQNASQVQGDNLVYHAGAGVETAFSRSTTMAPAADIEEDEGSICPMLQAEYFCYAGDEIRCGMQLGVLPGSASAAGDATTFRDIQRWTPYELGINDRFNLMGVAPPPAPYEGTFLGPGPLISNMPAERSLAKRKSGAGTYEAWNAVHDSVDTDFITLSLGVVGEGRVGLVVIAVSGGATVNWTDTEARHSETLWGSLNGGAPQALREWSAKEDESDIRMGAYAQGSIGVLVTGRIGVHAFARYDWTDDLSGSVGPAGYEVDLDGYSVGGFVSYSLGGKS
jgi:hypothetical protein